MAIRRRDDVDGTREFRWRERARNWTGKEASLIPIDAAKIQFSRRVVHKAGYIRSSSWIIPSITIVRAPALNYLYRQTRCFYSPRKSFRSTTLRAHRRSTSAFCNIGRSIDPTRRKRKATRNRWYFIYVLLSY